MADPCTVSGVLNDASGALLTSTKITFQRTAPLQGVDGDLVAPVFGTGLAATVTVTTHASTAAFSVDLMPGVYKVTYQGPAGVETVGATVPAAETATLAAIIGQATIIDSTIVQDVFDARDEAEASATAAAGSATSAASSAAAAGVASGRLVIPSFAQVATDFVYADPDEGQQIVTAGDVIFDARTGQSWLVLASGASGAHFDYTGSGGIKVQQIDRLSEEITVGTAGQFTTLNAALSFAGSLRKTYASGGASVTIRILDDGWAMQEQVIAAGVDLSFVRIVSDQATPVVIDRASVTQLAALPDFQGVTVKAAAFMASNGAKLPVIACNFAMNTSGSSADQCGMLLMKNALGIVAPGYGFHDCAGLGAHVVYGSVLVGPESEWSGNGTGGDPYFSGGVRGDWVAQLVLAEANIHDNVGQGVMANGGTILTLRDGFCTDNGDDGVQGGTGSILHLRGATITGNAGRGVFASEACVVRFLGSTVDNNGGTGLQIDSGSKVSGISSTSFDGNGGYGVRCQQMGKAVLSDCTANNNAAGGYYADGGDIFLSSCTAAGNPAGDDLMVNDGGRIQLSGTITTSSGTTAANNVTDSNCSAFNTWRSSGEGGIFGRGGRAENRGTATITAANTSVTVTHAVDFSPVLQEVSVTPTSSLGTAAKFWVNTMTATTFQINLDAAPGSSVTFGWQVRRTIA